MRRFWVGVLIVVVLAAIGFLVWWFLAGGNGNSASSNINAATNSQSPSQQATAKKNIENNWEKFFNGATPADQKVALLQNGQQFSQTIDAQAKSPTAKATTASVTDVNLNGSDKATVTYNISENGQAVLKNQTGTAVKESGTWKVSDTAFCNLLQLSGTLPPSCPGASNNSTNSTNQQQQQQQTQTSPQSSTQSNNTGTPQTSPTPAQ